MRINFDDVTHPKRVARSLKKALAEHGVDRGLRKCEQLAARMFGYRDWHDLANEVGKLPASSRDADLPAAESIARRVSHIAALEADGIPSAVAKAAVDAVRPTGRRMEAGGAAAAWLAQSGFIRKMGVPDDISTSALRARPGMRALQERTREVMRRQKNWAQRLAHRFAGGHAAVAECASAMMRDLDSPYWGPLMHGWMASRLNQRGKEVPAWERSPLPEGIDGFDFHVSALSASEMDETAREAASQTVWMFSCAAEKDLPLEMGKLTIDQRITDDHAAVELLDLKTPDLTRYARGSWKPILKLLLTQPSSEDDEDSFDPPMVGYFATSPDDRAVAAFLKRAPPEISDYVSDLSPPGDVWHREYFLIASSDPSRDPVGFVVWDRSISCNDEDGAAVRYRILEAHCWQRKSLFFSLVEALVEGDAMDQILQFDAEMKPGEELLIQAEVVQQDDARLYEVVDRALVAASEISGDMYPRGYEVEVWQTQVSLRRYYSRGTEGAASPVWREPGGR